MRRISGHGSRAVLALTMLLSVGWRPTGAPPDRGLGAGWPADPTINVAIVDTAGEQSHQRVLADAGGGVFVSWDDPIRTWSGLRLQRLTARGAVSSAWPPLGMLVADTTTGWQSQVVVRSGADAVIASWIRDGSAKLFAQRVDTNGVRQWTPGGVQVSPAAASGIEDAVGTPDGGVILFYRRDYGFTTDTVLAMRLDGAGQPAWPKELVLLDAIGLQRELHATLVSDSDVVAVWMDGRTTPNWFDPQAREIYAQKLRLDGSEAWTHNGKRLLPEGYTQDIRANGAGGFVGTFGFNTLTSRGDLKVVNIDANGDPMPGWPAEGLVIASDPQAGEAASASVSPTDGSVMLIWGDGYNLRRPKALKIDVTGNILWPNGGIALYDTTVTLAGWGMAPDGEGGAFVTIEYPLTDTDIIAQHVFADGSMAWPGWGVPVTSAPNVQYLSQVEPDSSGGVFVCWQDWRHATTSSDPDLYAQHVNADGSLGGVLTATAAAAIAATVEDGCAKVAWLASDAFGVEFTVQRRLGAGDWSNVGTESADGTGTVTHRDCDVQPGATYAYRLEWNDAGTLRYTAPISLTIEMTQPLALALPAPNPIAREASLEFTLPRGGHVRLEVLDLAGRRVATLLDANEAAGVHRVPWRPTAGDGGRLAPGCYVLRLSTEGRALSRRVVILR